jgi:hypothetical protein
MLSTRLQSEALRTYLFTYSSQYNSLSLDQLCQMFNLPEKTVYNLVSKVREERECVCVCERVYGWWGNGWVRWRMGVWRCRGRGERKTGRAWFGSLLTSVAPLFPSRDCGTVV